MSLLPNKKVASKNHQTFMKVEQVRPQQKQGKLLKKETKETIFEKKKTQLSSPVFNGNRGILFENYFETQMKEAWTISARC